VKSSYSNNAHLGPANLRVSASLFGGWDHPNYPSFLCHFSKPYLIEQPLSCAPQEGTLCSSLLDDTQTNKASRLPFLNAIITHDPLLRHQHGREHEHDFFLLSCPLPLTNMDLLTKPSHHN